MKLYHTLTSLFPQRLASLLTIISISLLLNIKPTLAQNPLRENAFQGQAVPRDVREIYERGLQWLENNQDATGRWKGGESGPGVTGHFTHSEYFTAQIFDERIINILVLIN